MNAKAWDTLQTALNQGLSDVIQVSFGMTYDAWDSLIWQLTDCTAMSRRHNNADRLALLGLRDIVGDEVTTDKGAFHKRFVAAAFKHLGVKFTPTEKQLIAAVVDHWTYEQSVRVDVVNEFNWQAGAFADSGSCFFNARHNRPDLYAIKEAGGVALRVWDKHGKKGCGRAWAFPHTRINAYDRYNESPLALPQGSAFFFNWYGLTRKQSNALLATLLPGKIVEELIAYDFVGKAHLRTIADPCPVYINNNRLYHVGDAEVSGRADLAIEVPIPSGYKL